MRKGPWDFIEKTILGAKNSEAPCPRMLVVTGIGGCGKTQIVLKFMRVHAKKYVDALRPPYFSHTS
jgi:hypothetical protein